MFLKHSILALMTLVVLCGNAMASSTPVDAKGFIEVLNANFALSPITKNHITLQTNSSLNAPYTLTPTVSEKGYELVLQVRPEALKNPILAREILARVYMHTTNEIQSTLPQTAAANPAEVEVLANKKHVLSEQLAGLIFKYEILETMLSERSFQESMVFVDTALNARLGSVIAQSQLAKMELAFEQTFRTETMAANYLQEMPLVERTKVIQEYASLKKITIPDNALENLFTEKDSAEFNERALKLGDAAQKDQLRREKAYRDPVLAATRNDARKTIKLDELLKKNDREGVARLFETMLPWELFEPTEVTVWKNWIESIRRPSKNTITLYRGLDKYDHPIKANTGMPGYFAAMINRNQGSYSDRVRSLATPILTNRNSNLTNGLGQKFYNHAEETPRSPFISFSLDIGVAAMFAEKGLIAVQVDRRRAMVNMFSPMKAEAEVLVPMIIFPDEVRSLHTTPLPETLAEEVVKKTGVPLPTNFTELTQNGKIYSDFYKFMNGVQTKSASVSVCSKVFLK
jgi:hypothetical protein